jgi:uncharacterized protein YlxP (DUF503 family)
MSVGLLTLHLYLPGCTSLKEKRRRVKPILARLRRQFNVSAAEVDRNDAWQQTVIACVLVSNDPDFTRRALQQVASFVEASWPGEQILDQKLELL